MFPFLCLSLSSFFPLSPFLYRNLSLTALLFCQSLPPPLNPEIVIMLHNDPVAQPNYYGRSKLSDFCLGSLVRYQHICQIRDNLYPIIQHISPINHCKFRISYLVLPIRDQLYFFICSFFIHSFFIISFFIRSLRPLPNTCGPLPNICGHQQIFIVKLYQKMTVLGTG